MSTLFHYTTASGLLGILRSGTLWATDFRFLNDAQEAVYARRLFVDAVSSMANPALDPLHPANRVPAEFGEAFDRYRSLLLSDLGSHRFPVYVSCFCESGDLLSQWRAYGADHGYAVEFACDALVEALGRDNTYLAGCRLVQVRYGSEAAEEIVSAALEEVVHDTNLGLPGTHAYHMALRLTAMLASIKHPGFQEEREWRIVFNQVREFDRGEFRATPMAIVPYVELPFPKESIVAIRVGPGQHVDVRREGVSRMLSSLGYDAAVVHSEVPLR